MCFPLKQREIAFLSNETPATPPSDRQKNHNKVTVSVWSIANLDSIRLRYFGRPRKGSFSLKNPSNVAESNQFCKEEWVNPQLQKLQIRGWCCHQGDWFFSTHRVGLDTFLQHLKTYSCIYSLYLCMTLNIRYETRNKKESKNRRKL